MLLFRLGLRFSDFVRFVFSKNEKGMNDKLVVKRSSPLKQTLNRIGILFLCVVFSSTALSQAVSPGFSGVAPLPPPFLQKGAMHGLNFAIQFTVFQMAISAHIYREYGTDYMFYRAPKNPEPGTTSLQQFGWDPDLRQYSWDPAKQFFVFYGTSTVTEWKLNRWGNRWNLPFLNIIASASGMGTGYLMSQIFVDVAQDSPLLKQCVQDLYGKGEDALLNAVKRIEKNKEARREAMTARNTEDQMTIGEVEDQMTVEQVENQMTFKEEEDQTIEYPEHLNFSEFVRNTEGKVRNELYIPSCKQLFLNWVESGKLTEFIIDWPLMLLASGGSRGALYLGARGGASLLNRTRVGSSLLAKGRFIPGVSHLRFIFDFYAFLEVNGLLDEYAGNPLKAKVLIGDLETDIHGLKEIFDRFSLKDKSDLKGKDREFLENVINFIDNRGVVVTRENLEWLATKEAGQNLFGVLILTGKDIKLLERIINSLDNTVSAGEDLEWLATTQAGQSFFVDIISRLDPKGLKKIQRSLNIARIIEENSVGVSGSDESNSVLKSIESLQQILASYEAGNLEFSVKDSSQKHNILDDLISKIKVIGFRFARWPVIKGRSYQEAFSQWKNHINKTTSSYTMAEELLGDLWDRSRRISQLRDEALEKILSLQNLISDDMISDPAQGFQSFAEFRDQQQEELQYREQAGSELVEHVNELIENKEEYLKLIGERLEFLSFDPDNSDWVAENRYVYSTFLCPYLDFENLENTEILLEKVFMLSEDGKPGWIEWCAQPDIHLDIRFLVYQTLPVLKAMLEEKIPELSQISYEKEAILRQYLSDTPDELFANGTEEVEPQEKARIARAFIEVVESFPVNQPPPVSEQAWRNMLEVSCFVEYLKNDEEIQELDRAIKDKTQTREYRVKGSGEISDDIKNCRDALDHPNPDGDVFERASHIMKKKIAAGAVYLLRELLDAPPQSSSYIPSGEIQNYERDPRGFPLTGFVEVYKGLEEKFAKDEFITSPYKSLSPYTFLHDFICGTPEGAVKGGSFSAPQMFPTLSPVCDFLNNNETDDPPEGNPALTLRNRYFHTPVTIDAVSYPSVYEAVEVQVRDHSSRGGQKEVFLSGFNDQTRGTILTATGTMKEELENLKAEYIVPELVNPGAVGRTQCRSIKEYYTPDYTVTEVRTGSSGGPLRMSDLDEQMDSLKGLEIHLFQIQFWLEWIRNIHHTAKGEDLNGFDDSADSLDSVICFVLERLKSYHDAYVRERPHVYLTREESEAIKDMSLPDALEAISGKSSFYRDELVLIAPSLMMSLVLKAAWPEGRFTPNMTDMDLKAETKQEALMHALMTELKNSVNGFYGALNLLYLLDGVKEVTGHEQTAFHIFEEVIPGK